MAKKKKKKGIFGEKIERGERRSDFGDDVGDLLDDGFKDDMDEMLDEEDE